MEKLSYFDYLAQVIPGGVILISLSYSAGTARFLLITKNPAIDAIAFVILSFIIGAFFHQLGKVVVEPIIKKVFWESRYYSEIFLVKKYSRCKEPMRSQILAVAKSVLHFDKFALAELDEEPTKENNKPWQVSQQIFRKFDYYTSDNDIAKKGHLSNTLYSEYRTLTIVAIVLVIMFGISPIPTEQRIILTISSAIAILLFLFRSRSEGERYVQGILYSVVKKS